MRRARAWWLSLVLLLPSAAQAQEQLPQGHPPVAAPEAPEQDAVVSTPSVPAGTIQVKLVDQQGQPLPKREVKLGILFQKIAEGEERTEQRATTDDQGLARFSGLSSSSDFSYRLTTRSGPAEYASAPIQLKRDEGVFSLLHVYPVTRNVEEATVGSRGFIYVETRDDVFQFEVLFRVFNMGKVTWVPEGGLMSLPSGYKAFKAAESMSDVRFEEETGRGARLAGTFTPGQHNVSFRFQVPRHEEPSSAFRFGLPPHTAEIRVIAEAAPSMELDVDGFERPVTDVNQNGQRVLVTRRVAQRGEPALADFNVVLSGIPTPGPGRWIAALIAAALAAFGGFVFAGKVAQRTQAELLETDAARARDVLMDELLELERARRDARIGPSSYETARRTLIEALSRIVSTMPVRAKAERPRAARKGQKSRKKPGSAAQVRPSDPSSTG